ncbi:MAG: hypothetical protein IH819_00565 [Bacteroidetes bacterium]|nr:hypothetical protein [Bacteroidota bacterium]
MITKADHLDESRNFIEDIYDLVKERDDNWTDEIQVGHFVRVTFEQKLTNDNDITIYARSNYLNSSIEVYEKDENVTIATFETINEDKKYQIFLTNLIASQDVFDLKIINAPVEFDYIVDPALPSAFCDGGDLDTTCWINRTHYLNETDNILSANNVIINGDIFVQAIPKELNW